MLRILRTIEIGGLLLLLASVGCVEDDRGLDKDRPSGRNNTANNGGAGLNACDAPPACGGDLVGRFELRDACFELPRDPLAPIRDLCPQADVSADFDAGGGEVVFADDAAWSLTYELRSEFEAVVPEECLNGDMCRDLEVDIGGECDDAGEECECLAEEDEAVELEGTYELRGDVVILTTERGERLDVPYCVEGDALWMALDAREGDEPDVQMVFERL